MLIMASCSDKSGIGSSEDAIQTEHYQFHASKTVPLEIDKKTGQVSTLKLKRNVPKGWKPNAMMIGDTVFHLDKIWEHVNELLQGGMIPMVNMYISHGGWASTAVRSKESIFVSAIHFANMSMDDVLNRIAHESCHLGLNKMSGGEIMDSSNKFIDEAIALYAGFAYIGKLDSLNKTSEKIAYEDLQAGKASMGYLRNWQENVRKKQAQWLYEWGKKNPGKRPTSEDFIKGGYRSYYTAYHFSEFFREKYGQAKLLEVVRSMGESDISVSFPKVVSQSLDDFVSEWHASLK